MAVDKRRMLLLLPIPVFLSLLAVLVAGFYLGRHDVHPSALLGAPFPSFESMKLRSGETVNEHDLKGEMRLVNVWASWCAACVDEHDVLTDIVQSSRISLIGISYKDERSDALNWLTRFGDPYEFHLVDRNGDLGVNLGVYGAPETFLLDRDGVVRYKHIGAMTLDIWRDEIEPLIDGMNGE